MKTNDSGESYSESAESRESSNTAAHTHLPEKSGENDLERRVTAGSVTHVTRPAHEPISKHGHGTGQNRGDATRPQIRKTAQTHADAEAANPGRQLNQGRAAADCMEGHRESELRAGGASRTRPQRRQGGDVAGGSPCRNVSSSMTSSITRHSAPDSQIERPALFGNWCRQEGNGSGRTQK